ncbi:MAG: nuclear transport factor 2 family protein [Rhodanobacter sp.]
MTTIKDAVHDLLNNPQLTAEQAADRHFDPAFRQRTNGSWDDRAGFMARIVDLKKIVGHATITVLDELVDGNRYAERHIIDLLQRNGTRVVQEVFVFAERGSDGRFVRIEETTQVHEPV